MHDALGTPEGLRALANQDIATVYRLLNEAGVTQRDIAALTGQKQSEVSEILKGRKVIAYNLLEKISDGLDIPRGLMGLAYDEDLLPPTAPEEEVDEDVKRRALIALAGVSLFDQPILGKLLELPKRPETPTPLPSKLALSDVTALDSLTAELRSWAQHWGGGAEIIGAIAERSERLLSVDATDMVRNRMQSTLAKLYTVAGWAAFDECLDDNAREQFARAMSLGGAAKDPYWIGFALYGAGRVAAESGHPNESLKYYQMAQIAVGDDHGRHNRAPAVLGYLHGESALELATLGHSSVTDALAAAQDSMTRDADLDTITAETHLRLGNVDRAEPFAASAVRRWQGSSNRRHAAISDITLAVVYVTAGDPRGLLLANKAITSVAEIRSARARARLRNLIVAMEGRPGSDYKDLAMRARKFGL